MSSNALLILLTYFIGFVFCFGQVPPLSTKDSVGVLLELAKQKVKKDPGYSLALATRAHRYAFEANDLAGEGESLFQQGRAHFYLHQAQASLSAYQKAASIKKKINDPVAEGQCYNSIATVYIAELHQHTQAYHYCNKAMSLLQHDSTLLQNVLSNLAALHYKAKKYKESLSLYQVIYRYYQKHNDLPGIANTLNNIASAYEELHDYRQSIAYYEKSLELNILLNRTMYTSHVLLGLACAHCRLNEHARAHQEMQRALVLAQSDSLFTTHVNVLQSLATESVHLGKTNDALRYASRAEEIAQAHKYTAVLPEIFKQLSSLYQQEGDLVRAYAYQQKYSLHMDSAMQEEREAMAELNLATAPVKVTTWFPEDTPPLWITAIALILGAGTFLVRRFMRQRQNNFQVAHATPQPEPASINHCSTDHNITGLSTTNTTPIATHHLEVIHGEGIKIIGLKTIWWFQKEGKNYHAVTENENYRVKQTIAELENVLPQGTFFRINRSVIINTCYMNNYSYWENHKYIIRMKNDQKSEFLISRNRLREMKEVLLHDRDHEGHLHTH